MKILESKLFDLSLLDEFDAGKVVNPFNTGPELAGPNEGGDWSIDDIIALGT